MHLHTATDTLTAMATKTESISIADLELQHRGGDLRDPEEPVAAASRKVHHTVVSHLQAAAVPRFKLLVAGFSLFCAGANDGTLGPLIPYIINTFHIGTGEVAIMYVNEPLLSRHRRK